MHAIGGDAWLSRQRMQASDLGHHVPQASPNEAADLNNTPPNLTISEPIHSPHHYYPEASYEALMPIVELARDHLNPSRSIRHTKNSNGSRKVEILTDDPEECTDLVAKNMEHASSQRRQYCDNENIRFNPCFKDIQNRVRSLPSEIQRTIMDTLFEETFGPRNVHPQSDPSITNIFLSLNKKLYLKYSQIYWSKNTWIIGPGAANASMRFMTLPPYNLSTNEFSRQIPNNAALRIRRVVLRFSREDLSPPPHPRRITRHSTSASGADFGSDSIHSFEMLDEYRRECKLVAEELKQIWQDKFDRVAFLELEHLTLDVTQAYAPDGVFLGVDAVRRALPFVHGMPLEFVVLARTRALEREVRGVVGGVNRGD